MSYGAVKNLQVNRKQYFLPHLPADVFRHRFPEPAHEALYNPRKITDCPLRQSMYERLKTQLIFLDSSAWVDREVSDMPNLEDMKRSAGRCPHS